MRRLNHLLLGVALMVSLFGSCSAAELKIFGSRVT